MGRWAGSIFASIILVVALPREAGAFGSCSFQSVAGVAFGPYNVFLDAHLESTGTLIYRCNGSPSPVTIDLSRGNAPTFDPRFMLLTTEQLTYNLYVDFTRTQIWGDGTSGTFHYTATPPKNADITVTIYGRIPKDQDVSVGNYADTVIATIIW